MKKHIYLLFAAFVAGGLSSCNDALDLPDDGRISYESIWSDRNRTIGYLNTCYNYVSGPSFGVISYTDDAQDAYDYMANSGVTYWYSGLVSATSWPLGGSWSNAFVGIRYCNVFIQALPNATAYAQEEEKKGWIAQAQALRAYYYLTLIREYGGVPLITEPYSYDHDFSSDRRAKVWEIVKQILQDTDDALAAPGAEEMSYTSKGFRWVLGSNYANMMHRALAYAIRSEAIMLAVSPLHANEEGNPYTWEDAARITKEALDQCLAHDYSLFTRLPVVQTDSKGAYDYYFFTPYDYDRTSDKETIYGVAGISVWNYYGLPTNSRQSSAGISPTQELIDSYETADGHPILKKTGDGKYYKDDSHLQPNFNEAAGYDDQNPYENRDPRFYQSVYFNGAQRHWDDPDELVKIYDNAPRDSSCAIDKTTIRNTRTGYYMRKYDKHTSSYETPVTGYVRRFRLAELYLNFAEAANEAYGPTQQVEGYSGQASMSAVEAVNAVRTRADMPNVRDEYTTDRDVFRDRIWNERRVEFAFEPLRFYDIRRWKILDEAETVVTGMRATKNDSDGTFTYKRFVVSERKSNADTYLLFPLPTDEVNKMYKLTGTNWQNPGYESPE